jgi:hypothetical protein
MLAEIAEMNADELDGLTLSADWQSRSRDLFPPDQDRLAEAIELRRAALRTEAAK